MAYATPSRIEHDAESGEIARLPGQGSVFTRWIPPAARIQERGGASLTRIARC
jgi:hypothetical protein